MSIKTEITRISNAKTAIKVDGFHFAVIPKGGAIPTDNTICFVYGG